MNKGFVIAGNMIVDVIKIISAFPERHSLVNIVEQYYSLGGLVNNVTSTMARLDPELPIKTLSRIGEDAQGDYILKTLGEFKNVDLSLVKRGGINSYTDVLTEQGSGVRSFLTYCGADGEFDIDDVPIDKLDCDMFHAGYVLLLPTLDKPHDVYGTRMAHLLHDVQQAGILTSLDVVSEVGDRYKTLVPPALKYVDYFIVNEIEAGRTVGIELRDEHDKLLFDRIPAALHALKNMGVSRWAVIHAPEGGFGMDEQHKFIRLPSLKLPDGFIKGTVGAGDAFCAGTLLGAYQGKSLEDSLKLGIAAAACSLSEQGGSDGVKPLKEALELYESMPKQIFPDKDDEI